MGKNKRKRRNEELELRLRSLERRLEKRSFRDHVDESDADSESSSRSKGERQADVINVLPDGTESMISNLPQSNENLVNNLPEEIESLLGKEGDAPESNLNSLHDSLAKRWTAIIKKGLEETVKQSLLQKYRPPQNCQLLVSPKLNEEVAAAINENGVKRDKRISLKQEVLASAITAIGNTLNTMMCCEGQEGSIEQLSDSARLLCDLFHGDSNTRRSLILPGLNKDMKELMEKTPVSEYLFGDKLLDKMNAAKAVKKSGLELIRIVASAKPSFHLLVTDPRQHFTPDIHTGIHHCASRLF